MQKNKGFTLIEMVIAVAIIGILAAISFPAYDRYKIKGYRMDAISYLTKAAAFEEKWIAENGIYTSDKTQLGGNLTERGLYNITVTLSGGNTAFSIVATPVSGRGQAGDTDCVSFTIDSIGRKTAIDSGSNDNSKKCWGS